MTRRPDATPRRNAQARCPDVMPRRDAQTRGASVVLPLLTKKPAQKSVNITDPQRGDNASVSKFESAVVRLPGATDLRARACSLVNRRHTLIQWQLTAARFNTSLQLAHRGDHHGDDMDVVWDEYVKAAAEKRRCADSSRPGRRGLAKQLDQLSTYMEAYGTRRSSLAAQRRHDVHQNLRGSQLRQFEVLRKMVSPRPRAGPSRCVHIDNTVTVPTSSKQEGNSATAPLLRRRKSVRLIPFMGTLPAAPPAPDASAPVAIPQPHAPLPGVQGSSECLQAANKTHGRQTAKMTKKQPQQ